MEKKYPVRTCISASCKYIVHNKKVVFIAPFVNLPIIGIFNTVSSCESYKPCNSRRCFSSRTFDKKREITVAIKNPTSPTIIQPKKEKCPSYWLLLSLVFHGVLVETAAEVKRAKWECFKMTWLNTCRSAIQHYGAANWFDFFLGVRFSPGALTHSLNTLLTSLAESPGSQFLVLEGEALRYLSYLGTLEMAEEKLTSSWAAIVSFSCFCTNKLCCWFFCSKHFAAVLWLCSECLLCWLCLEIKRTQGPGCCWLCAWHLAAD